MRKPVTFQKRHFEFLARLLDEALKHAKVEQGPRAAVVKYFADELRGSNPRFNYDRFTSAVAFPRVPKRKRRTKLQVGPPANGATGINFETNEGGNTT